MQRVFRVVESGSLSPIGANATKALRRSVSRYGVLTPVLLAEVPDQDGELQLTIIDGNRRTQAAQNEGVDRIPAVVLKATTEKDRARLTLVSNYMRSLNFHTESSAIVALAGDAEDARLIGHSLGIGPTKIERLYSGIEGMPEPVRRAMNEGRISVTGARMVVNWPDPLKAKACKLVSRGRYVYVKTMQRLHDEYMASHPELRPVPKPAPALPAHRFEHDSQEVAIDLDPETSNSSTREQSPEPSESTRAAVVGAVESTNDTVERAVATTPASLQDDVAGDLQSGVRVDSGTIADPLRDWRARHDVASSPAPPIGNESWDSRVNESTQEGQHHAGAVAASSSGIAQNGNDTASPGLAPEHREPAQILREIDAALSALAADAHRSGWSRAVWMDRVIRAWESTAS